MGQTWMQLFKWLCAPQILRKTIHLLSLKQNLCPTLHSTFLAMWMKQDLSVSFHEHNLIQRASKPTNGWPRRVQNSSWSFSHCSHQVITLFILNFFFLLLFFFYFFLGCWKECPSFLLSGSDRVQGSTTWTRTTTTPRGRNWSSSKKGIHRWHCRSQWNGVEWCGKPVQPIGLDRDRPWTGCEMVRVWLLHWWE